MKTLILSLCFGLAGCGQPDADESSLVQPPADTAPSTRTFPAHALAVLSNANALNEAIAAQRADADYAESRTLSEERMAERDRALSRELALAGNDAAALEEILREHREASLRVQDLVSALATSGVSGSELRSAIERSPEMANATQTSPQRRVRAVLGQGELARFEAARAKASKSHVTKSVALAATTETTR